MFRNNLAAVMVVVFSQVCHSATIDVMDDTSNIHVSIYDTDTINILNGGAVASLNAYDSTNVNLQSGGHISHLHTYDNSLVSFNASSDVSHSSAYGNSHFEISGGDVAFLRFFDSSSANIYQMDDLSYLIFGEDTDVSLFGSNFLLSEGRLSGNWQNGDSFSFWLMSSEHQSIPPSILYSIPENLDLVAVPEPSSVILFISGLLLLSTRKKLDLLVTGAHA